MADERRDWTFRLFDTLYVRAHGCLACAQLCLMVYAVCPVHHVPRTRLEGPCEGRHGPVGGSVGTVTPTPLGGRTASVFWGEDTLPPPTRRYSRSSSSYGFR
eukprot:7077630-Prymnesium_polylepis.1